MKYLKAVLVITVCLSMSGCGLIDGFDAINSLFGDNGQAETVLQEEAIVQSDADEDVDALEESGEGETVENTEQYEDSIAWSGRSIIDTENDDKILYCTDADTAIAGAVATDSTVYALIGDYDSWYGSISGGYRIIAMDKSAGDSALEEYLSEREIVRLEDKVSYPELGYYNGTLYLLYSTYDKDNGWQYYIDAYKEQNDGSYIKTEDDLSEVVGYLLAEGYSYYEGVSGFMAYLNKWDRIFLWNRKLSTAYSFDLEGNLCREYMLDSSVSGVRAADGNLLVVWGADGYYIYDLETAEDGTALEINCHLNNVIGIKDGYVYYYEAEQYMLGHYNYFVYRYNVSSGKETLLYETRDVPGQPYMDNGITGFSVVNDCCYFMQFEEGSLGWYSCDMTGEEYTVASLGQVDDFEGIYDTVSVVYENEDYVCSTCGKNIYQFYFEAVELSESEIPFAEEINEIFRGNLEEWAEFEETFAQDHYGAFMGTTPNTNLSCEYDHMRMDDSLYFDGIKWYVFQNEREKMQHEYLEIYFYGYANSGGTHGSPSKIRFLFDLSDGSPVSIGDICDISEEEFRTLVAEYTVQDYREQAEEDLNIYFPMNEDGLYNYAYSRFDFEQSTYFMRLSDEGVVIMYDPYSLGSYASGFIEVTIPYEELGIELIDAYGVYGIRGEYA